ncbi:restriction endonuclease subunit S [Methanobrevibacter woesei]|uniref:restriction endonuclease subunit S n=1 Tax=Methanobrevibacter woesei TaxID=190976 RepID=UPI003208398F
MTQYERYKKQLQNEIFNKKLIKKELKAIKLKDICTIKKGNQLNKSDMVETGEYYVLNGGKNPSGFTNSWNVNENTITISEGGNSCGYVSFNTEKFYCGGHCYYLNITSDVDNYYLFNYLKFIELKIMRLRVGSGLPNIQKGDIDNLLIKLPPIKIQEEIGLFFKFINNYILLKENEKEMMINFKKALLQQMFI